MAGTNGRGHEPPAISELWSLRSDYEDVPVPGLGGKVLRVYALTGTARAQLVPMLADLTTKDHTDASPDEVRRVLEFQGLVVGASLGYPQEQWGEAAAVLGSEVLDQLYAIAARLSGLESEQQAEAVQRLRRRRSVASGTG